MNFKQIEILKLALLHLSRQGSLVSIPAYGISGKIAGVGFRPYWTGPADTKIEKLELNIIDKSGKVKLFNFDNVIGYDVVSNDGRGYDTMKNATLDIHIFSTDKQTDHKPMEKVRIEICSCTEE